jgi:hypothetical protein
MLVLVGVQGSGKSTLSQRLMEASAREWVRVNQVGDGAVQGMDSSRQGSVVLMRPWRCAWQRDACPG